MKIDKIPKNTLRIITKELISNAKSLEIELDKMKVMMIEENVGSINFLTEGKTYGINYFKREDEIVFLDVKKGESELLDRTRKNLLNKYPGLIISYR